MTALVNGTEKSKAVFGTVCNTDADLAFKRFFIAPIGFMIAIVAFSGVCFVSSFLLSGLATLLAGLAPMLVNFAQIVAGGWALLLTVIVAPLFLYVASDPALSMLLAWTLLVATRCVGYKQALSVDPIEGLEIDKHGLYVKRFSSTEIIRWWDISKVDWKRERTKPSMEWILSISYGSGWKTDIPLGCFTDADSRPEFLKLMKQYLHLDQISDSLQANEEIPATFTRWWIQSLDQGKCRERKEHLQAGTALQGGKYVVNSMIKIGGQSCIYDADEFRKKKEKHPCVLKECVIPSFVSDRDKSSALRQFKKELKALRSAQHRSVVKVLDSFIEDHRAYIVMEKVPGKNLKELVSESGALSEQQVIKIGLELCNILNYLQLRINPLVHGDISPDNLMLTDKGKLILLDFGSARRPHLEKDPDFLVKRNYAPIEQLQGITRYASDIYSMGATMYFLLTGMEPEPLLQSDPASVNDKLSSDFCRLVAACTHDKWTERPSAYDVQMRLQALVK